MIKMEKISHNRLFWGHVVAVAVVACWGGTFVNTKYLLMGGLAPHEIFLCRFLLAYVAIWSVSPRRLFCSGWRDELLMALLGLSGGSLYFLSENWAVGISYVNNVAFIVCTAPLLTTILAILFFRSVRATPALIIGSLVALTGVALVIFNGHFVLHLNPLGDALALGAALCWSVYSLLMKRASTRYSSVFITRKVFFYGLLTILPVFIFQPWHFPLERLLEPVIWMNIVFLGLIASFVCFVLWNWSIARIGAMRSSNYIYLNPVTTLIASAIFLHEPMTTMAYAGSVLILVGVFVANRSDGI